MISSSGILVDSGSRHVLRSTHSVRTVALLTLACPIHMESHGFYTTPGAVLKKKHDSDTDEGCLKNDPLPETNNFLRSGSLRHRFRVCNAEEKRAQSSGIWAPQVRKKRGANKIDWHGHHLVFDIVLHPWKLTYPLRTIDYFNRKYIFQPWISSGDRGVSDLCHSVGSVATSVRLHIAVAQQ